jgi:hypothetical protein
MLEGAHLFRSSFGLAALVFFVSVVVAAPLGAEAPARKLRVLLVTGNKSYARQAFLDVFHSDAGLAVTHIEHTATVADAWERADTTSFDAVVLYDMPRDITDAQKARFLALFGRGISFRFSVGPTMSASSEGAGSMFRRRVAIRGRPRPVTSTTSINRSVSWRIIPSPRASRTSPSMTKFTGATVSART